MHDSIFACRCQKKSRKKRVLAETYATSPAPPLRPAPIFLASTSPYRRELLQRLRVPFEARAPGVDEALLPGEAPRAAARRLARAKAESVGRGLLEGIVIGSDQTAELDGAWIGKPGDHEAAVRQLRAMRAKTVFFHTALAVLNVASGRLQSAEVPTQVRFRDYSDEEIERYVAAERPYDCTGSAKIEGLGILLVEAVIGEDPTALIGLPLIRLAAMLRQEGVVLV